jgi:hypothetical protein
MRYVLCNVEFWMLYNYFHTSFVDCSNFIMTILHYFSVIIKYFRFNLNHIYKNTDPSQLTFPSVLTGSSISFVKLKFKIQKGWLKAWQGYSHNGWGSTGLSEMELELWTNKQKLFCKHQIQPEYRIFITNENWERSLE